MIADEDRLIIQAVVKDQVAGLRDELVGLLKQELLMNRPVVMEKPEGRNPVAPGLGPLVMQEIHDLGAENESLKLALSNIKRDRENLRAEVATLTKEQDKLASRLEIFYSELDVATLKDHLKVVLAQLERLS